MLRLLLFWPSGSSETSIRNSYSTRGILSWIFNPFQNLHIGDSLLADLVKHAPWVNIADIQLLPEVSPVLAPLQSMLERTEKEKLESDVGYFNALMYMGEAVMKFAVAGLVAAVQDDLDRNRYRLEYRLVRADGLGVWDQVLDDVLVGASSQFLDPASIPTRRALTERMSDDTWQFRALRDLSVSLQTVHLESSQQTSGRIQGRSWFKDFVVLRNGTRAHGAPPPSVLVDACPTLATSINEIVSNLPLFSLPWAYLYRNLSGKYRVTTWGETSDMLDNLRRDASFVFDNGVYIELTSLRRLSLVDSDPDASDYWLANGAFNSNKFEMLSYLTNERKNKPSSPYLQPAEELPASETEGLGHLSTKGLTFTNIPEPIANYVPRLQLEKELDEQLRDLERHPIITLTGRGGIGKTSTALEVITNMIDSDACPYDVVVWFSSRDVDLLPSGPKAVRPQGLSVHDFATEYANLLVPSEMNLKGFNRQEYLGKQLAGETIGPTLFVFDNFETTTSQVEVFKWLDTYIRGPNKVLITSRSRGFTGDYEVQVPAMAQTEAEELIVQTAKAVGVNHLINSEYREELIRESSGHPYVIKLMIGEVARGSSRVHPERIMAAQGEALVALFERSYNRLSPAAQRVFLTLCKWRSSVPALAVEAVLLRPENERIDVGEAIEELVRGFFVEEIVEGTTGESEVGVPLAARLFGLGKLGVSVWQVSIETDISILHLFGPRMSGTSPVLGNRIQVLFRNVAEALSTGRRDISEVRPVLDFLTTRYSYSCVLLSRLFFELYQDEVEEERYLLKYVEGYADPEMPAWEAWKRIAAIRRNRGDARGELHALAQSCRGTNTPSIELSEVANQISNIFFKLRWESPEVLSREEKQFLVRDVVGNLELALRELNPTDLSRLAWLQLHLGEIDSALVTVNQGLSIDPENSHCLGLKARLSSRT